MLIRAQIYFVKLNTTYPFLVNNDFKGSLDSGIARMGLLLAQDYNENSCRFTRIFFLEKVSVVTPVFTFFGVNVVAEIFRSLSGWSWKTISPRGGLLSQLHW